MKSKFSSVAVLSVIFFATDLITKFSAISLIGDNEYHYLNGLLHFQIHGNTGVAFGIPIPVPVIIILNILLLGVVIYFFNKELKLEKRSVQILLSMIVGGALANLFDRFYHGAVVDFIGIWQWPYFNFADAYIVTAILLLFLFHAKINRVTHSDGTRKSS